MKKILLFLILLIFFYPRAVLAAPTVADWFMAGGNPQRTSWVSEEVRGNLNVEWYQPIEPYIPYKIQPIFYNNTAYVSTSKGLYAFDLGGTYGAGQSRVKWVYPTELPLGHSPTIATVNGKDVAYVGGFDKRIYAIDITNGQALSGYTPFEAGAGFETNPLVIGNTIYAGNRDGKFYALNATTGAKVWEFQTGGPISFSAAFKNNTLYFASNDSYAYALNATNGTLFWKSQKLPGAGFYSYWPLVYTDKVSGKDYAIFTASDNYRQRDDSPTDFEPEFVVPGCRNLPAGAPLSCPNQIMWQGSVASSGDPYWTAGTALLDPALPTNPDIFSITSEHEQNPHWRSTFVLDAQTGSEVKFDSNANGISEYAPLTFSNVTQSGTKYPGMVSSSDNIFYQTTMFRSFGQWIPRGDIVGTKVGSRIVSRVAPGDHAIDEPVIYSGGGKLIYWGLCCDREAGAFDVTIPFGQPNRGWLYFDTGGSSLLSKAPDYRPMYFDGDLNNYNVIQGWQLYSGKNQSKNGVYSNHMETQSPPIPYLGKVYLLRGNTLLAMSPSGGAVKLALTGSPTAQNAGSSLTTAGVGQKLEAEISKMIAAGPLRPGYFGAGFQDLYGAGAYPPDKEFGEIFDYFQNPADTVYTLLLAYPYVSPSLQGQIKTYLQTNYGSGAPYSITSIAHVGWNTGVPREAFDIPSEIWSAKYVNFSKRTGPICGGCGYWKSFPPFNFYAGWKYAQIVGGNNQTAALAILNSGSPQMRTKIEAPPTDLTEFIKKPYMIRLYLAGYLGYMNLQQMAGETVRTDVQGWSTQMQNLLKDNFNKDTPYWGLAVGGTTFKYPRVLSISRNFMFLTPEVANFMNQNLLTQSQTAVSEYEYVAPYWFVSKEDNSGGEGTFQHLYDGPALFQAKAWILKQPFSELVKYLDVPAFERGDLFYIQNLVAALDAASFVPVSPIGTGDANSDSKVDAFDLKAILTGYLKSVTSALNQYGVDAKINAMDFVVVLKKLP